MVLLDLQGLQAPSANGAASGGSGLTVLTCHSHKPSNLSVALCH
ncbi:SapB/AmfS family lanthipeptide [Actinomadura flavalba]|nr:SapB/AmfS family lanthipeptide [Actinomadura flavalba]